MREVIFRYASKYKPFLVMVENNAFQDYLVQELQEISNLPLKGFTTGKQKADPILGIPSVAALFETGQFIIPRGDDVCRQLTDDLIDECLKYPSGHSGDMLMALWFACEARRDLAYHQSDIKERIVLGNQTQTAGIRRSDFIW